MNATHHTFGDTREDGFRFLCYEKRAGNYREKWCHPDRFERVLSYRKQYVTDYWKTYQRPSRKKRR